MSDPTRDATKAPVIVGWDSDTAAPVVAAATSDPSPPTVTRDETTGAPTSTTSTSISTSTSTTHQLETTKTPTETKALTSTLPNDASDRSSSNSGNSGNSGNTPITAASTSYATTVAVNHTPVNDSPPETTTVESEATTGGTDAVHDVVVASSALHEYRLPDGELANAKNTLQSYASPNTATATATTTTPVVGAVVPDTFDQQQQQQQQQQDHDTTTTITAPSSDSAFYKRVHHGGAGGTEPPVPLMTVVPSPHSVPPHEPHEQDTDTTHTTPSSDSAFYKRVHHGGAGGTEPPSAAAATATNDTTTQLDQPTRKLDSTEKRNDTDDSTISDLTNPTTLALSVSMRPIVGAQMPRTNHTMDTMGRAEPQLFAEALIVDAGPSGLYSNNNNNPIFLPAHAAFLAAGTDVDNTDIALASNEASSGRRGATFGTGRTSSLLLAALIVLLTALVSVGIVCGTGGCVRGDDADISTTATTGTSTTTTGSNTDTDLDRAFDVLVSYINSVTLSERVIEEPPTSITVSGGNETRPEELALAWLIETIRAAPDVAAALALETPAQLLRMQQRYALASFLLQDLPRDALGADDECTWMGITCAPIDPVNEDGEINFTGDGATNATGPVSVVTEIDLARVGWDGVLVPDLGLLANLVRFDMVDNNLFGTIPTALGGLTRLEFFNVGFNDLTGSFPDAIQLWSAIQFSYFYGNEFVGTIPSGICSASGLVSLGADCLETSKVSCPCFDKCICF